MLSTYHFTAAERFMRYVKIDTQSDPNSNTSPTTEKQKNLTNFNLLVRIRRNIYHWNQLTKIDLIS